MSRYTMGNPITVAAHSSEGGHFYTRAGEPCYTVLGADGKSQVTPDVRHCRKLGLVPSVTTISSCAAKPGLETWKLQQGIMAALTLPRRPHEADVEYIKRIVEDSKAQARKAAEDGEAIHASLQGNFEGKPVREEHQAHVAGAVVEIEKAFGKRAWMAEGSFAHPLGFGGKIDLEDGDMLMGDFKTKIFDELPSATNRMKLHWPDNAMQGAAYKMGKHGTLEGGFFNVYVSRSTPGLVHLHQWEQKDLEQGWQKFLALLAFWKADKAFDSGWIAP